MSFIEASRKSLMAASSSAFTGGGALSSVRGVTSAGFEASGCCCCGGCCCCCWRLAGSSVGEHPGRGCGRHREALRPLKSRLPCALTYSFPSILSFLRTFRRFAEIQVAEFFLGRCLCLGRGALHG